MFIWWINFLSASVTNSRGTGETKQNLFQILKKKEEQWVPHEFFCFFDKQRQHTWTTSPNLFNDDKRKLYETKYHTLIFLIKSNNSFMHNIIVLNIMRNPIQKKQKKYFGLLTTYLSVKKIVCIWGRFYEQFYMF